MTSPIEREARELLEQAYNDAGYTVALDVVLKSKVSAQMTFIAIAAALIRRDAVAKERDLYKAIWNMNPCCWFDQKSAEREMLDTLRSCLDSLDAMVEAGYLAAGSFQTLVDVTTKYEKMRDETLAALPEPSGQAEITSLRSRIRELEEGLRQARSAIVRAAEDTLWCDDFPAETVVDRIDACLGGEAETGDLFAEKEASNDPQ